MQKPFETLDQLEAYQLAREFRKEMYAVARRLPEIEKYALANQIRRAAVSLTNNIAEGHGRHHYRDQIHFLVQARGSLEELVDDLNVCVDEHYLPDHEVAQIKSHAARVQQIINGYGRHLRNRLQNGHVLHDAPAQYLTRSESESADNEAWIFD